MLSFLSPSSLQWCWTLKICFHSPFDWNHLQHFPLQRPERCWKKFWFWASLQVSCLEFSYLPPWQQIAKNVFEPLMCTALKKIWWWRQVSDKCLRSCWATGISDFIELIEATVAELSDLNTMAWTSNYFAHISAVITMAYNSSKPMLGVVRLKIWVSSHLPKTHLWPKAQPKPKDKQRQRQTAEFLHWISSLWSRRVCSETSLESTLPKRCEIPRGLHTLFWRFFCGSNSLLWYHLDFWSTYRDWLWRPHGNSCTYEI